jgi:hypothetical protein
MQKYNKTNHKSFVNNAFGVASSEEARLEKAFGSKWNTIDFQFNPDLKPEDYPIRNATEIGMLIVGNHEIAITKAEAERIIHTLDDAVTSSQKRFRIGTLN